MFFRTPLVAGYGQNRTLYVVSTRCFLTDQKILFLVKVIAFLNLENTYKYSTHTDLNRDFLNMTNFGILKPIFSYVFYPITLNLNLVVLGVN